MAKKITKVIKLQIPAAKANPAPPVGPILGQAGINIAGFCSQFNAATQDKAGYVLPVVITVYEDRSFTFVIKTPPASDLLRKAAGVEKGSGSPKAKKVGTITRAKCAEIAQTKMPDLNAGSIEAAISMISGTARSMGVTVED